MPEGRWLSVNRCILLTSSWCVCFVLKRPGLPDPPTILTGSRSPSWRCPLRILRYPLCFILKPSCSAILTSPCWDTPSSWCSFLVSASCRQR